MGCANQIQPWWMNDRFTFIAQQVPTPLPRHCLLFTENTSRVSLFFIPSSEASFAKCMSTILKNKWDTFSTVRKHGTNRMRTAVSCSHCVCCRLLSNDTGGRTGSACFYSVNHSLLEKVPPTLETMHWSTFVSICFTWTQVGFTL